jgi:hypothetical protein
MSFGNPFKDFGAVEEALILALLLISMLAIAVIPNLSWQFRLEIGVLTFAIIFLASTAAMILKQQKEAQEQAAKG